MPLFKTFVAKFGWDHQLKEIWNQGLESGNISEAGRKGNSDLDLTCDQVDLADQSADITNSSNGDLDIPSETSIERESQEVEQTTSKTKSSREKITEMSNERRYKNTTIPVDQQLLALSKEEMTFKKDRFKQIEVQDKRFNKSMNALLGNVVQLTNVISNSMNLQQFAKTANTISNNLKNSQHHQQQFATNSKHHP